MDIQHEFGDPERICARLEFHRRVIAEEEAARQTCDRVLTGPSQWWAKAIQQVEGSRMAGMVAVLIERSETILPRSPVDALALSEIAVDIAKSIAVDAYPYDHVVKVRGQAYRRHAYVLSFVGKLREARTEAERSAFYLKQIPVPPPELARLDLVRSNIARNMEKYGEAIAHARQAGENFLEFGDREGWLKAIDSEAAALYSSHDHRGALAAWQSMERYSGEMSEQFRAAWLHNVGLCAEDAGKLDEAARYYSRATEAFEKTAALVYRVKARCSMGRCLLSAGKPHDSIPILKSARDDFESFGMEIEAALAALLLAEALLAAGHPEHVPAVCRHLVERFTRAGITGSAMTALAYLRESVATGHGTPLLLRHVHAFMRDLNGGFEQPFVPLHEPRLDA
ncbi:MAG TPA: tetratricopeptide repeat protein [Thermoanaerobaculia bacterium]|jgi:tetratricopeptide (TPR) repeat protein|nr:tetratricopeptide repeat protein [Thermoanaerobaculia bacterium]